MSRVFQTKLTIILSSLAWQTLVLKHKTCKASHFKFCCSFCFLKLFLSNLNQLEKSSVFKLAVQTFDLIVKSEGT